MPGRYFVANACRLFFQGPLLIIYSIIKFFLNIGCSSSEIYPMSFYTLTSEDSKESHSPGSFRMGFVSICFDYKLNSLRKPDRNSHFLPDKGPVLLREKRWSFLFVLSTLFTSPPLTWLWRGLWLSCNLITLYLANQRLKL